MADKQLGDELAVEHFPELLATLHHYDNIPSDQTPAKDSPPGVTAVSMTGPALCGTGQICEKETSGDRPPSAKREPTTILPPCRICSDKATGFHYGTNTCEACKGFFRRTLAKDNFGRYECSRGKNCQVHFKNRANCAYCRLQRCLTAGMSKEGIRRGRYTLEKKAHCIREVKILQNQKHAHKPEEPPLLAKRRHDLEELIVHVDKMSRTHTNFTPEFLAEVSRKQQIFLAKRDGREVPVDDVDLFGLDASDGPEAVRRIQEECLSVLEKGLIQHVNFCKSLPGFLCLSQEDQINLVKASLHMCHTLTMPLAVNLEAELFSSPCGQTVTRGQLSRLANSDICDELFVIAKRVKRVGLKEPELALLKAISVFLSDDTPEPLQQKDKVEAMQYSYIEALQYFVERTYSQNPEAGRGRLGSLLNLLTLVRKMAYLHDKYREDLFARCQGMKVPLLLLEFLSS